MVDCLGIERLERSDEPPRVVGRIEREGYQIEKLVFEAVPGLPVPALLYLPDGRDGPVAAVVHAPGHWMENAKLEPDLQRTNAWLARSGVAVLCYDTLGQGERRIGWHQHGQLATLLVGFTTLAVMVAESRRALDLLCSRAEVDAGRLGILGASGGGWSSIFTTALDERVQAAAIACIANTHLGQIRAARGTGWDGAVCLCNQLPGLAALGSIAQIMALAAPRALLMANAVDDPPFPIEGARRVAAELGELYSAAGATEAFAYAEVSGGHGLRAQARAEAVSWLARRLGAGPVPEEAADERLLEAPYETTYGDDVSGGRRQTFLRAPVRLEGECADAQLDSNGPLVTLARARAARLRTFRPAVTRATVEEALGPFPEPEPIATFVHDRIAVPAGVAERISFLSEGETRLDAVLLLPATFADDAPPVVVLLDEGGKAEALGSPEAERARALGCALFAPDVRGTGESACAEFETVTAAWMVDRDALNQRVWDVLRSVECVRRRAVVGQQVDRGRIAVWGRGAFGLLALLAAALDETIAGAGASGFVSSLEELLVVDPPWTPMLYRYRLLERLDVDDLAALVAPRPALISGVDDALAELVERLG